MLFVTTTNLHRSLVSKGIWKSNPRSMFKAMEIHPLVINHATFLIMKTVKPVPSRTRTTAIVRLRPYISSASSASRGSETDASSKATRGFIPKTSTRKRGSRCFASFVTNLSRGLRNWGFITNVATGITLHQKFQASKDPTRRRSSLLYRRLFLMEKMPSKESPGPLSRMVKIYCIRSDLLINSTRTISEMPYFEFGARMFATRNFGSTTKGKDSTQEELRVTSATTAGKVSGRRSNSWTTISSMTRRSNPSRARPATLALATRAACRSTSKCIGETWASSVRNPLWISARSAANTTGTVPPSKGTKPWCTWRLAIPAATASRLSPAPKLCGSMRGNILENSSTSATSARRSMRTHPPCTTTRRPTRKPSSLAVSARNLLHWSTIWPDISPGTLGSLRTTRSEFASKAEEIIFPFPFGMEIIVLFLAALQLL